jgi:hypothetical protein
MATRTSFIACTGSPDSAFLTWINTIHSALIAFGWVQTADTGQIDFTRATQAGAGFAIYGMGDAAQSTCAFYLKITYTQSNGSGNVPGLILLGAIGGTNGSGTLTGNVGTQFGQTGSISMSTQGVGACRFSGNTSSFRMQMWSSNFNRCGWTFAVERDQDTSGNDTTLGINMALTAAVSGGSVPNSQFLRTAGGAGAMETRWYAMLSAQPSQSGNGVTGVAPVRCTFGPFRNPMKGLLIYAGNDYAVNTVNPVTIYGASRNYLFLVADAFNPNVPLNTWQANCGIALLWE